jgi:hypothetical protein
MNETKLDSMKCDTCIYKQDFVDLDNTLCPSCNQGTLIVTTDDIEKSVSKPITQEEIAESELRDIKSQQLKDQEKLLEAGKKSRALEIKEKLDNRTASMEEMMEYMTLTREI